MVPLDALWGVLVPLADRLPDEPYSICCSRRLPGLDAKLVCLCELDDWFLEVKYAFFYTTV